MEDEDIEKLLLEQKETLKKLENYINENKKNKNKEDENKNDDYLELQHEYEKLLKDYENLSKKYNEVESDFKESLSKFENFIKENESKEKEDKEKEDKEKLDYLELQQEYGNLFKEYSDLSKKYNEIESDFKKYKNDFNTQSNNDKNDVVSNSKKDMDYLTESKHNSQMLTLKRTEEMYKTKVNTLNQKINSEFIETNTKLLAEVAELNNKIEVEMSKHKQTLLLKEKETKELSDQLYSELGTSKTSNEAVKPTVSKSNEVVSQKVSQKVSQDVASKNSEVVTSKASGEATQKNNTVVNAKVSEDVAPKDNEVLIQKVNKEATQKNGKESTPKNIKEVAEKVSFELKLGTKYTNILGFIFIIISILLLAQYSYVNFATSDLAKTIMFYSSGVITLVVAEILNNRGKNTFSIGLTAGGISILFLSTGIAYFYFNIITSLTGIILVVLTAVVAFLLSLKYDRQIISVFAIVGAYLPIIVLFDNDKFAISALVYFLICNIFSSLLAYKKRWNVLSYFSVILNFLSISVVFVYIDINKEIPFLFTMLYLIATLLFYVTLSLINPVKNNVALKTNELILLFSSIVVGSGLCYTQLYAYDMEKYNGIFSIVLSVIFYCLGLKLRKILDNRKLPDLMYIASLIFAILVAPMQLNMEYLTMAWMVMAIVLLWYSSYSKSIEFMYAGTAFLTLAIIAFFWVDISLFKILYQEEDVLYKYTVFTVGCIISLYIYMKNEIEMAKENILFKDNLLITCFKAFNILNTPFYIYYVNDDLLRDRLGNTVAVSILIVTICAYIYYLLKTKLLTDKERILYANLILAIMYLGSLVINYTVDLDINSSSIIINIVCVIIYNIALLYVAGETLKQTKIFNEKQLPIVKIVLLMVSMLSIMGNANVHLGALNTLIFGVIAFVCILQGLKTLNTALRRFGLYLTIISICKFFMFDLSTQNSLQKILSYFVFGLILISISYLYQKLLQKYEVNTSDIDVNKNNGTINKERVANEVEVNSNDAIATQSEVTTIDKSEDLPKE